MVGRTAVSGALVFSAWFVGSHTEEDQVGWLSQDRTEIQQPALEFSEVVPGVYRVRGIGVLATICNAVVIVNENDVIVVDTYVTPGAASALLEELRTITPHPVRYVVNTHFHIDHSFGNQAFPN
ncbi:MAG: MBL fold metallo-hydrolase, partial [Gemmatimonadota bacterium]